jgi:hypothetical protein
MKLKGINIIERHVEKAFFLLVTLVFAGVVVWQFALGGNAVSVGGQQDVPVDKAYEQIARIAEQKLAQMEQAEPDNRVPTAAPDAVSEIRAALAYSGPDASLPIPLGPRIAGLGSGSGGGDLPVDRLIAVAPVEIPRPDSARAGEYAAALDPLVVAVTPALEAYVPAQQPFDLRAVSIAARFDSAGLLEALRTDPDGERGPMRAIPEPWWRGRIEILDVEIERREVMADGARSGGALVRPAPGRFTLRDRLSADLAIDDMPSIVADARQNAKDIVQPAFWNVIAGEPWAPPSAEAQEGGDEAAEIARLLRALEGVRAEIARAEAALGGGTRGAIDIFDPASGVLAQGVSGGGGGGGRGGGDGGPSAEQLEQDRRQRQRAAIEARLADRRAEETDLIAQLQALGVDPDVGRAGAAREALPDLPARIADAEELTIWGHDLEVEGGRSYEYRVRVLVNNPLFGFANNLAEESRAAASEPVLASEWSAWTSPVTVDQNLYWFATRASEGGRQAVGVVAPTTTVEVYRFYYGYWRRDEARVRIGDPIGASIDLAERELPIFTIERPDGGGAPFVAGRELISESLHTATGALLLDVRPAAVQTGRERPLGVVVREPGGELATRRPADDLISDLRRRLEQSAGAGLLAAVGVPGEGLPVVSPAGDRPPAGDRNEGAAPAGGDRGIQR